MAQAVTIDRWVRELSAISAPQFTIPRVLEYLRAAPVDPESLKPYIYFSKGNYTRNLIHKSELFEMLTICWEVGQVSRIHNHRDQNCWMAVPIGRLRVQNFRVEDRDAQRGTCRLAPTDSYIMDPAHPAAVDPDAPVHQVLNDPEFAARTVSVHIYSRPYNSCEVYLAEKGTYFDVPLGYTSEYGRLNPDEKLL